MDTEKYIGRLLDDRYEILEVIGVGGMAVVYKARCHRLNRLVAIKILKDDLGQDEEFRRRFHGESQAVAMLSHPNIMAVYDVSATDSADYIVMELIDGITLKQYMEKKGVLNWKETLHFAMQIAKALEHAHSRGIVHRDIKPHNIMVLKNGSVKVTDFGIARIMSSANTLTKEALGSVHYISPEQAKGGRVDNRSDIYSLGVVMYEMMTGRPPYDGEAPVAVAIQHINGGAVMPSVLNPNIPGGLEQIIMKAMAQDPAKRYLTATSLLYDLEELRKNPGMLFDMNSVMEDTTTRIDTAAARAGAATAAVPVPPKTTAERVASNYADRPSSRVHDNTMYRAKREAEKERERINRNRAITTAVVAGSVVAIVAIIIFMVVLLNGGLSSNNPTLVPVPELIGKYYDRLDESQYPNLEITVGDYVFSEEFEDGQIVDQKPAEGTQVPVGSEVKIYISMGPEQMELPKIIDLKDMTPEAAQNYLRALGGDLKWELAQENSDEVSEGYVTRTEPAKDTQLVAGQTVTIFVSAGPEKKLAQVPAAVIGLNRTDAEKLLKTYGFEVVDYQEEDDLAKKGSVLRVVDENGVEIAVGKDLDVTTKLILVVSSGEKYAEMPSISTSESGADAKARLEEMGFTKVNLEEEFHPTVAEGKVIRSNIPAGTKVDVTTSIILTVSKGPEPTQPPETKPTEPPTEATTQPTEPQVTQKITIQLPGDKTEPYVIKVMFHGETVAESEVLPGTETYEVVVTGSGTGYLEIYIDGTYVRTEKVEFRG